jgi:alkylation response protein AidB-like acyl-CoA dehydrogenase
VRFELTEDQHLLRTSTRDFLAGAYPMERCRVLMESERGYDADDWAQLAEMGYLGLTAPDGAGGQGLGAIELAVVCEEIGRHCVPGPFLDAALTAFALGAAGGQDALLKEVVAGTKLAVLARENGAFLGAAAPATRVDGGRMRGAKHFVPFAAQAHALVVTTADGLWLVQGPFDVTRVETIDPAQRFASVRLDHAATRLGDAASLERLDQLAAIAAAAELLGLMTRCLDATVQYSQTREAFRRPIGAFQALQHRMADMLLKAESTRSAVYRAAWCWDTRAPETPLASAAAKAYAGDAARLVCGESIQMHGGIGFTWEVDLHFFFKRAKTLELLYGSTETQLERALAAAAF